MSEAKTRMFWNVQETTVPSAIEGSGTPDALEPQKVFVFLSGRRPASHEITTCGY